MGENVKAYDVMDYERLRAFLKRVTTLDEIDERVLKCCSFIERNEQIIAMVSYEMFDDIGMVRYFIYDQTVTAELIINMFFSLYYEAKEGGVKQLVAVASTQDACQLFEMLGFSLSTNTKLRDGLNIDNDDVSILSIDLVSAVICE